MTEEWRAVVGFGSDHYEVSSQGRVRRREGYLANGRYDSGRILKFGANKQGRLGVIFCVNNERRRFLVSRLVLTAFLGLPPEGKPECRHWDGDYLNNRIENLLWGSHAENMADKLRHGTQTRGQGHPAAKLRDSQVREIRSSGDTQSVLAARFGVTQAAISGVLLRRTWKHVQ